MGVGVAVGGLLATQGQLRQRHGLMREALRGQHGEGMAWRAESNLSDRSKRSQQQPMRPSDPPLTVDVAVKRHHARPFRAAEGGVMQLVGQGRGDPGLGVALGGPAMLRRVLFMSCSAVLKPHL